MRVADINHHIGEGLVINDMLSKERNVRTNEISDFWIDQACKMVKIWSGVSQKIEQQKDIKDGRYNWYGFGEEE